MSDSSLKNSSINTACVASKLSIMSGVHHNEDNEAVDESFKQNMADFQAKQYNDSTNLYRYFTSSSPAALQDVTMDNSYGYKSPCVSMQACQGTTSPATQGRSVREFEEQMAALRKENFNLKLRLYFIEESIPGYQQTSSPEGQETFMKQLIDTKVEIEILRKEIQEKQELLKEAAQAMNQMERIQKETEKKSQAITDELNQKIQLLEMEKEIVKSPKGEYMNAHLGKPDISDNGNSIQRIHELEGIVKESEEKLNNLQEQVSKFDTILQKREETIKEYEDKVKELVFQNAELVEMLENKEKEVDCAERSFRGLRKSNAELKDEKIALVEALRTTQDIQHRKEMLNMKTYECQMREQQEALIKMQLERVCDELQQQKRLLADRTCLLQEAEEQLKNRTQIHEKACRTIQKLMLNISNQQDEICKLKNTSQASNQVKKPKANGSIGFNDLDYPDEQDPPMGDRDILNNEISACHKQTFEAKIAEQDIIIRGLKDEVKKKTANLQNLVNKELWGKNREIERLTKLINIKECSSPKDSSIELQQSFSEEDYFKALEHNETLQKKVDILIQRISMNRNNDALIMQLQSDLREATNDAEQAEKWRRECVDVCCILSNRLEELANFLNSLLKHKDVLGMLAADRRKAMRKAVKRSLDLSKNLNITLSITGASMTDHSLLQISNLSEMFGDVVELENKTFNSHEKLKTQSLEILEVGNTALKQELEQDNHRSSETIRKENLTFPLENIDNQSESEAWSEPDRKVSMARIGLDEHLSKNSISTFPKVGELETDSESELLNNSRLPKTPPTPARGLERVNQLVQIIEQRDERILEIQCQLVDADSQVKREHIKVLEVTEELEQLRRRNEELHADMIAIGSERIQNICQHNHSLLRQAEENSRSLKNIQEERDRFQLEARVVENQIAELRTEMDDMKQRYEEALVQAQEQEQRKLKQLQTICNEALEARLAEQQLRHEDTLARDWISRALYEENQHELKKMLSQLKEARCQIEYLKENEAEMKQTLIGSELATRVLKKQLDESTIEASKAVLERTRALNEKVKLEKRVDELSVHLQHNEAQLNEMQRKIEQLSSTQLELQQQLNLARKQVHKLHGSDVSNFGYSSEEVPPLLNEITYSAVETAEPQRFNTSSPDLGIESDAGRVLSTEMSSAEHSNLKAVELHSILAGTKDTALEEVKPRNVQPQSSFSSNVTHNCAKVDQENIELRRKLVHTKRALEDTYEKLRVSNQRKAQVEKDIKNQILKTHNVLRNVRSNMENEL